MSTPNQTTTNHDFQLWADGQEPWEHRSDFEKLDTRVEISDLGANRGNYTPKNGAIFRATDTRKVYKGDGSTWQRHDPPTTGVLDTSQYSGAGVASRIENALADLQTRGTSQRIDVTSPDDGSTLTWDKRLDLDMTNYPHGVHIKIHQGVEINGTLQDWWMTVVGALGNQEATFCLEGTHSEIAFTGDDTAAPGVPGFIRIDDQTEPEVRINTRNFENGNTDGTAILFRNVNTWSEGWTVEGNQRGCDRALDFQNIGGFPSFRDGDIYKFSAQGNDYAVRLEGNQKGLNVHNLHIFYGAANATGLLLDGNVNGAAFNGTTFDDTQSLTGITAIETGPSYAPQGDKCVFHGLAGNNVDTWVTKNSTAHDVWELFSEAGYVGLRDVGARDGSGSVLQLNRTGTFEVIDDAATSVFTVTNGGVMSTGVSGALECASTLFGSDGIKTSFRNGTPFLAQNQGSAIFDDGTNLEAGTFAVQSDVAGTESALMPVRHPDGSSSLPAQDLSTVTPTADRTYYSNGTNLTRGPAFFDGTTFTSLVDSTTYTPP